MGGNQAAETLLSLRVRDAEKSGKPLSTEEIDRLGEMVRTQYQAQTDIRYGAARGWVDAIIAPDQTRLWVGSALSLVSPQDLKNSKYQPRDV
jgi:acetyl-CoA carboxylase carboxyltransferase component